MVDDRAEVEELLKVSKAGARHVFLHYVYFPERTAAEEAAAELRSLGFKMENRLGADGVDWLVLARKELVPSEEMIATALRQMEEVTRRLVGEYDGWEAEAPLKTDTANAPLSSRHTADEKLARVPR